MEIKKSFRHTKAACYIAGMVQAMVCGFVPLLVVIFNRDYGISLSLITVLLTVNFVAQFTADLVSIFFVNKVSRRACIVAAHIFVGTGYFLLGVVPFFMKDIYWGVFLSVVLFSTGGGLLEVMTSPILDSCPSENKAAAMSILHSMFSFGSIGVILLSSMFFWVFGQANWQYLPFIWSIIALLNAVYLSIVPIKKVNAENKKVSPRGVFKQKQFFVLMLVMMCGGASEIAMSQWASAFAESSLGVSKTVGDILGPCMFALMMGISRITYPFFAHKINLMKYIKGCSALCVVAYLIAALSPFKAFALAGCGLCGFAVGIMWPGTVSLAARSSLDGGTAIFALIALAGDIGCTVGPMVVGFVSSIFGGEFRAGLLAATIFPLILFIGMSILNKKKSSSD